MPHSAALDAKSVPTGWVVRFEFAAIPLGLLTLPQLKSIAVALPDPATLIVTGPESTTRGLPPLSTRLFRLYVPADKWMAVPALTFKLP